MNDQVGLIVSEGSPLRAALRALGVGSREYHLLIAQIATALAAKHFALAVKARNEGRADEPTG